MIKTLNVAIVLLFLCAIPGVAQSWEELRTLQPGEKIRVLIEAGKEQKGTFKAVSPNAISIETKQGEVSVDRPHVRRVQIRSNQRRLRNTLIGAAIGVGVGIAIDQTLGQYLRNESGEDARALNFVVPIALFGGIGALVPATKPFTGITNKTARDPSVVVM